MNELHKQVGLAIESQLPSISEAIVTLQYERQPEQWKKYGQRGRQLAIRDQNFHLSYLIEAIAVGDSSLFVDYVAWVKVLFKGLNLPDNGLESALECTRDVLNTSLSPEMAEITERLITKGLEYLHKLPSELPSFIAPDNPLHDTAEEYLTLLLKGDRSSAVKLILNEVKQGRPVRDIYLHIFQPSQYEIGRLWQMNKISVAQEHFCSAATQLIMSQLYPYIFDSEKKGHRFVACCVGEELHEIGIRMVADFFEMDGWDTYYLGANTPTETIIRTLNDQETDVLGISTTMTFHINILKELIEKVKDSENGHKVKTMVGGYPFHATLELWKKINADGWARNAQHAIELANSWVNGEV